ncbi:conserved hypothetical protein [Methanococcus vannielii SB]|jgi:hypothetical protein|uniref:Uncharacterized protein n=1 Tax=Methanococcus vannielii (strain ATCC 35089 / DSM 1224 / JCM 13029 / OCM 148 / SB) TaxID=406327 RepID=A6URJ0_METVS|nr:hypothetical protein [Methanococcus vannielii]ABR55112.1 conserved hypothetical protein [Methanococcus vannielii SB]
MVKGQTVFVQNPFKKIVRVENGFVSVYSFKGEKHAKIEYVSGIEFSVFGFYLSILIGEVWFAFVLLVSGYSIYGLVVGIVTSLIIIALGYLNNTIKIHFIGYENLVIRGTFKRTQKLFYELKEKLELEKIE